MVQLHWLRGCLYQGRSVARAGSWRQVGKHHRRRVVHGGFCSDRHQRKRLGLLVNILVKRLGAGWFGGRGRFGNSKNHRITVLWQRLVSPLAKRFLRSHWNSRCANLSWESPCTSRSNVWAFRIQRLPLVDGLGGRVGCLLVRCGKLCVWRLNGS